MSDGRIPRRCQIVLLDDRRLDFLVQPRLLSSELLDMVASHFNLHEKEYFGLYHTDDIGNRSWLSLDRKVLDHDLPKYADPILFYFAVRFYVPSLTYFKEKITVELFYLQAKALIFKGDIHCESNTVFALGSYVLQATFGDYVSENTARNDMKKVPILPTRTLKEHPSITYCEDMVIGHYRQLKKMRRGQAIVEYLNKFRNIPTYGVHYYEVKDKGSMPWWIGMSPKGVGVYDHTDKTKPRKVYKWHQIENLYFKERKFSIEVKNLRKISEVSLDGERARSNSLGRRINGQSRVLMHAWYASTTVQAKAMWSMAISQHQFYLDKRDQEDKLTTPRTLEDIANELSRSSGSLNSSLASIISNSSDPSESGNSLNDVGEVSLSTEIAQKEMVAALKARKEALQLRLKEKTEELKRICFSEAAITGEYPPETPYNPNCPPPPVRKRVGTSFTFSDFVVKSDHAEEREEKLQKLERELEIQSKITDAAEKLANDAKASKNVRKSRKLTYQKSFSKLKSMEQAINRLKESQTEDQCLDDNSLNSYEDDVDSRPSLSRSPSFTAATGQRRISNTSSMDSLQTVSRTDSFQTESPTTNFQLTNGELSNHLDYLSLNTTPEFASSSKINEMLYRRTSNSSLQRNHNTYERLDSSTSGSSSSSTATDRLRPPPPSYAESHFSRRESSSRSHLLDRRRGSAPGIYRVHHTSGDDRSEVQNLEQNFENQTQPNGGAATTSTKVRYVGGLSSSGQNDSDYISDDVQMAYDPPCRIVTSDYDGNGRETYWLSRSSRNRSNIAHALFNHPSKLGIMNNNESTGSYFVHGRPAERAMLAEKAQLYSSTSTLNYVQPPSNVLTRSHYSNYAVHRSPNLPRKPLMGRFFHDGRGHWSDEDDSCISLV